MMERHADDGIIHLLGLVYFIFFVEIQVFWNLRLRRIRVLLLVEKKKKRFQTSLNDLVGR